MKAYSVVAVSFVLGASLWGQANPNPSTAPAAPPSPAAAATPAPASAQATNMAALQAGLQNRPVPSSDAIALRIQLNRQLALELQQMRVKLGEMKTNDANIKDPAVRKHLQLDAELWDLMFSHMNEVTSAMMQLRPTAPGASPAAHMYRRQMLPERVGGGATTMPTPAQSSVPAQAPTPTNP